MAKEESKNQISASSSGGESEDSNDFMDDSSMYEKKLNILHIPHIIFWKMTNQNGLKLENGIVIQG